MRLGEVGMVNPFEKGISLLVCRTFAPEWIVGVETSCDYVIVLQFNEV